MQPKDYYLEMMKRATNELRHYRYSHDGALPEIYLFKGDWEGIVEYWPRHYLHGPSVSIRQIHPWYKRLTDWLMGRKNPTLHYEFEPDISAIEDIRTQMRSESKVLIDGFWVKVNVLEGA